MKNKTMAFLGQAACLVMAALMGVMLLNAVTSGATAYRSSQQALESGYAARTLVDYVTAKALGANTAGSVYVGDFDGIPCLYIEEEHWGDRYITAIYCYEDQLTELFALADSGLSPADGISVIPCAWFEPLQATPNLIYLHFNVAGADSFGYISTLGEGAAR